MLSLVNIFDCCFIVPLEWRRVITLHKKISLSSKISIAIYGFVHIMCTFTEEILKDNLIFFCIVNLRSYLIFSKT